jgi:hypothetical protein
MVTINRMLAENGTETEFEVAQNSDDKTAVLSKLRYLTTAIYGITTQNTTIPNFTF